MATCSRPGGEPLFSVKTHHVTAVVLLVLGAALVYSGIFLLTGGIGTIPAKMGGFLLCLGGAAALLSSVPQACCQ